MVILFREETFKYWPLYKKLYVSVLCNYDQPGRNIFIFIIKRHLTFKSYYQIVETWTQKKYLQVENGRKPWDTIFKKPFMHFTYLMK